MPSPRPSLLHLRMLAALALCGCASGHPPFELPSNPPGCENVVQQHRDDPGLDVDSLPRPRRYVFPPPINRRVEPEKIIITFLVDETGLPVPSTVQVSGARLPATRRALTERLVDWRFIPAKAGQCWVPAPFSYEVTAR